MLHLYRYRTPKFSGWCTLKSPSVCHNPTTALVTRGDNADSPIPDIHVMVLPRLLTSHCNNLFGWTLFYWLGAWKTTCNEHGKIYASMVVARIMDHHGQAAPRHGEFMVVPTMVTFWCMDHHHLGAMVAMVDQCHG